MRADDQRRRPKQPLLDRNDVLRELVVGGTTSQIATLVDRKTRYLTAVQLADRRTETVVGALIDRFAMTDPALRRT
nr:hypothetical protein [Nocardia australiensis]